LCSQITKRQENKRKQDKQFEWLRQRIGLLLTVVVILSAAAVVAAVYTWRNWQDIQKLPGVPWIVARFRRRALPKASADRLKAIQ
jgi:hypothetical protein